MSFDETDTVGVTEQNNSGHSKDPAKTKGNGPPPVETGRLATTLLAHHAKLSACHAALFRHNVRKGSTLTPGALAAINDALRVMVGFDEFVRANAEEFEDRCTRYLDEIGNDSGLAHWNYVKWCVTDVERLLALPSGAAAKLIARKKTDHGKWCTACAEVQKTISALDDLFPYFEDGAEVAS